MRRIIGGVAIGAMALNCLAGSASAATCATRADLDALRTAAMQQELMVAALSCHEIARYNRFVLAHQPELIASDGRLKAFFVSRDAHGGEAQYHAYKTELANASSLRSIREVDTFCSATESEFDAALDAPSLSALVERSGPDGATPYPACTSPEPARAVLAAREDNSAAPRQNERGFPRADETGSENAAPSGDVALPSPHRAMDMGSP